jgi:hypothetical protein
MSATNLRLLLALSLLFAIEAHAGTRRPLSPHPSLPGRRSRLRRHCHHHDGKRTQQTGGVVLLSVALFLRRAFSLTEAARKGLADDDWPADLGNAHNGAATMTPPTLSAILISFAGLSQRVLTSARP